MFVPLPKQVDGSSDNQSNQNRKIELEVIFQISNSYTVYLWLTFFKSFFSFRHDRCRWIFITNQLPFKSFVAMGCLRCFSGVKSFHVKIILLDKQELIQEVQESTTGQQLLDNIFTYLNLIETAYFGLRYQDNGNQTVSKRPRID